MDCGVAQLVEQVAVNHRVGGSNPSTTANYTKHTPTVLHSDRLDFNTTYNLAVYLSVIKSLLEVGKIVFSFSAESGSKAALTTLS